MRRHARVHTRNTEAQAEEESEEEELAKPMFRPVFVPKYEVLSFVLLPFSWCIPRRGRVTVQELEKEAEDSEEALKAKELEAEERRQQSRAMVADSIRRELVERTFRFVHSIS